MRTVEEILDKMNELDAAPEFDTQENQDARGQEFLECIFDIKQHRLIAGEINDAVECYKIAESVIGRMIAGEDNETD
jgi:hypothetical protein